MDSALRTGESTYEEEEEKFKSDLVLIKTKWNQDLCNVQSDFEMVQLFSSYENAHKYFNEVENKKGLLENLTSELKDINEKETIFEINLTED